MIIDTIIAVLATFGCLFVFLAAVGIIRMPDTYLRMAVTTKAATLGIGLILISAAVYFHDFSTSTRVLAIILFILLTAPVGAHLMGKASYIAGNKLWEGTIIDELQGKYRKTGRNVSAPRTPKEFREEDKGEEKAP